MDFKPELATHLNIMMGGCVLMAALAIAFFFMRFWKTTKDRFFAILAVAFLLLAIERFLLLFASSLTGEQAPFIYTIRLVAFIIIIYGVIDKNRSEVPKV
ncbi:MAG: DUF5985 family protein [Pseudobdellovibrionaceae bacterium]